MKRWITGVVVTVAAAVGLTVMVPQPALALNHVYSSCWATRYEANTVDYGSQLSSVNNWFDCSGTTLHQANGHKTVAWDTDYYDPNWGYVQGEFYNDWPDGAWHIERIVLCKGGGGGCLFVKTVNNRPW